MSEPRIRSVLRNIFLLIACLAALSGLALIVFGGFDTYILSVRVAARDPYRSFVIAGLALAIAAACHGFAASRSAVAAAADSLSLPYVAAILAVVVSVIGITYASTVAGGPDPYGYVSQAGLWLDGPLRADVPVRDAPWPNAAATWSPLGYVPAEHNGQTSIVPMYASGLPLLMAAAKAIGGQEAIFWIVPIGGGLLVFWTFRIGVRLGSAPAGCIAAWLLATSPTLLVMLMQPMSDVPVAAAWAIAFDGLLGASVSSALGAGAACAIAVLIRPNLAPLALVFVVWFVGQALSGRRARRSVALRATVFLAAVAPGFMAVAAINQFLYGSPFVSGYGNLSTLFHLSNVMPNTGNYLTWLAQSQSPLALLGLAAVFIPWKRLWPGLDDHLTLGVAALFVVVLWAQYLAYLQFNDWPFLRFLLPSWPFIMLGVASVILLAWRSAPPAGALAAVWAVAAIGVYGVHVADRGGAFAEWQSARRYVDVARQVRDHSEDGSVVLALLHTGSVRYYGGRLTLRYDQLDREWLDRTVSWLEDQHLRVYALLEPWEVAEFEQHFAGQRTTERLKQSIVFSYRGPNTITFHDLTRPVAAAEDIDPASDLSVFRSVKPIR